jgi:hypothetical protein
VDSSSTPEITSCENRYAMSIESIGHIAGLSSSLLVIFLKGPFTTEHLRPLESLNVILEAFHRVYTFTLTRISK